MIVLLTDFGLGEHVGVMKGIILTKNPKVMIVDLSHDIGPQQVKQAAWLLWQNYRHFPNKTVFCVVVDPGVGGKRRPLAIKTKNYWFIGPDNGILWKAASSDGIKAIYDITRKTTSKTFHGRDVFAPVASEIDKGKVPRKKLCRITKMDFFSEARAGEVVHIDRFGNIITNLKHIRKKSYEVKADSFHDILPFYKTYESARDGLFLIEGSYKTLEISIKNARAIDVLKLFAGSRIEIY